MQSLSSDQSQQSFLTSNQFIHFYPPRGRPGVRIGDFANLHAKYTLHLFSSLLFFGTRFWTPTMSAPLETENNIDVICIRLIYVIYCSI